MVISNTPPRELIDQLNRIINTPHTLEKRGTGAPGLLLERLLGVKNNSHDLPDAGGWELKYHGGRSLLTLFHKTPIPGIKELIDIHGWEGRDGKRAFRFTLRGENRGFVVSDDGNNLLVTHQESGVAVQWSHNDIINSAASKLRRLLLVSGFKRNGKVTYTDATAYTDFEITKFIPAAISGVVQIDFDARYKNGKRSANAIRDHGTKFRVKINDLSQLYQSSKLIAPRG